MNVPFAEQKPLLGICLGAQMMARTLGARVYCHVDQRTEAGYYPIRPTPEGRAVYDQWPDHVYEWHREGFDLPPGAVLLAEGDAAFPVQAFRYGPAAFAIQFHPEVTYAMMRTRRLADWEKGAFWQRVEAGFSYLAFDLPCHIEQLIQIFFHALACQDALQHAVQPTRSFATRRALSA